MKVANLRREQSLEGGANGSIQGGETRTGEPGTNATKVTGPERDEGSAGGKGPEGNPKRVTGLKEGRRVLEEGNRQEGGKPWSRKVSGEANPSEPGFQFL